MYPALGTVMISVTLDVTDERLSILVDLLIRHQVRWGEYRTDKYTEEELNRARLLVMSVNTDHEVFGGPRLGTKYHMKDACPKCGAGARQSSAMMIKDSYVSAMTRLPAASTFYSDILVNEFIAKELETIGTKGLSFEDVFSVKEDGSHAALPFRQLRAARAMPPMSRVSTGIERDRLCTSCKRSGYGSFVNEPPRPAYRVKDIIDIDDVMTTWEWFGDVQFNGNVSEALLPYPWFLVSPKVMRVIRAAGTPAFHWFPVRVVDEA